MIVTTMNTFAECDITTTLGSVQGSATWTKRIDKVYAGGIRGLQQGSSVNIADAIADAKRRSRDAMVKEANEIGATAIIGLNVQITEVSGGTIVVQMSGTAVLTQPKAANANAIPPAAPEAAEVPEWQTAFAALNAESAEVTLRH